MKKTWLQLGAVGFLLAGGVAYWLLNRAPAPGKALSVRVSSYHKGAEIFLAEAKPVFLGVPDFGENATWFQVKDSETQRLVEGGYYYRLKLADGRTKQGVLDVSDETPILLK